MADEGVRPPVDVKPACWLDFALLRMSDDVNEPPHPREAASASRANLSAPLRLLLLVVRAVEPAVTHQGHCQQKQGCRNMREVGRVDFEQVHPGQFVHDRNDQAKNAQSDHCEGYHLHGHWQITPDYAEVTVRIDLGGAGPGTGSSTTGGMDVPGYKLERSDPASDMLLLYPCEECRNHWRVCSVESVTLLIRIHRIGFPCKTSYKEYHLKGTAAFSGFFFKGLVPFRLQSSSFPVRRVWPDILYPSKCI
jgi:hypothetical protein